MTSFEKVPLVEVPQVPQMIIQTDTSEATQSPRKKMLHKFNVSSGLFKNVHNQSYQLVFIL